MSSHVPPHAEEALARQTPSGGRRGDAASRDIDQVSSKTGHDGIGNPGTGGSHGKTTNATDNDDGVLNKPSEHDVELDQALAVERLMADANIGYDSVQRLREAGLTRPSDLAYVSKEQLRDVFQLKFFEAERLFHLVRVDRNLSSAKLLDFDPQSRRQPCEGGGKQ